MKGLDNVLKDPLMMFEKKNSNFLDTLLYPGQRDSEKNPVERSVPEIGLSQIISLIDCNFLVEYPFVVPQANYIYSGRKIGCADSIQRINDGFQDD